MKAACIVLLLALAGMAPAIAAGEPDARQAGSPLARIDELLAQGRPDLALEQLRAMEHEHGQDPAYLNLLGVAAMRAGAWPAAAEAFERLALLQPDNAGAWLDLALARFNGGDLASAEEFFVYIERHFDPPAVIRQIIASHRGRMRAIEEAPKPRGEIMLLGGYDSNANSGLGISRLPLTLDGHGYELEIDPAYRSRGDRATYLAAMLRGEDISPRRRAEWLLSARIKGFAREDAYSTREIAAAAGISRPAAGGELSVWGLWQRIDLGGEALLDITRAGLARESPWKTCQIQLGAEWEGRSHASLGYLDADLGWLAAGLSCPAAQGRTSLTFRVGHDQPRGERPGGQASRAELTLGYSGALPFGFGVEANAILAATRDREGYSPLLEDNAARRMNRVLLRALLHYPLGKSWQAVALGEAARQCANLPLFEQSNTSLYLGARYRFY